jgi:putative transposase
MTADWCGEVLEEAIKTHGKPAIFNTDQGSQFTSVAWGQIHRKIVLNQENFN